MPTTPDVPQAAPPPVEVPRAAAPGEITNPGPLSLTTEQLQAQAVVNKDAAQQLRKGLKQSVGDTFRSFAKRFTGNNTPIEQMARKAPQTVKEMQLEQDLDNARKDFPNLTDTQRWNMIHPEEIIPSIANLKDKPAESQVAQAAVAPDSAATVQEVGPQEFVDAEAEAGIANPLSGGESVTGVQSTGSDTDLSEQTEADVIIKYPRAQEAYQLISQMGNVDISSGTTVEDVAGKLGFDLGKEENRQYIEGALELAKLKRPAIPESPAAISPSPAEVERILSQMEPEADESAPHTPAQIRQDAEAYIREQRTVSSNKDSNDLAVLLSKGRQQAVTEGVAAAVAEARPIVEPAAQGEAQPKAAEAAAPAVEQTKTREQEIAEAAQALETLERITGKDPSILKEVVEKKKAENSKAGTPEALKKNKLLDALFLFIMGIVLTVGAVSEK